jgi:hypothetical protein
MRKWLKNPRQIAIDSLVLPLNNKEWLNLQHFAAHVSENANGVSNEFW